MSGEIAYNEGEVNSNALPYLNQVLESLKEALSSLEGIDASDLEIDLRIDEIKANINENISTISQIKSNIIDLLDEYIQADIKNRQLIDELLSDEKTTWFEKLLDIRKEKLETTEIKEEEGWDLSTVEYPDDFRITNEGFILKDRCQASGGKAYTFETAWYERYKRTLWYTGGYGHSVMLWQSQYGEGQNGSTIQSGGCGITSLAVAISELKHEIVQPTKYVKYLAVNGEKRCW